MTLSTYLRKGIIEYAVTAVLCVALTIIYEFAGHGVHSWRIRFIAAVPIIMLLLFIIMKRTRQKPYLPAITSLRMLAVSELCRNLFIGIIEVYGTATEKSKYFAIISISLLILTLTFTIIGLVKNMKNKKIAATIITFALMMISLSCAAFADEGVTTMSLFRKNKEKSKYVTYDAAYKNTWAADTDITSIYAIASSEKEIAMESHYQDVFNNAWRKFGGWEKCKICYHVEFTLKNGTKIDKYIMKPGDELSYRDYLENYMYDDVHVNKGEWYSHLEPEDADDDVIMSSMKVTGGVKVDEIASPIIITACVYDSADDFDANGKYIGGVSKSVQLLNEAKNMTAVPENTPAPTAKQEEITPAKEVPITVKMNGADQTLITDADYYPAAEYDADNVVTVTSTEKFAGLYIKWGGPAVSEWELDYNGKTETHGQDGFLHEFVAFDKETNECKIKFKTKGSICKIYAYSKGKLPDDVQIWEKSLEKTDLLVFSTHADDEVLFFGGAITTCRSENKSVQVVYMCNFWNSEPAREHEKLDGLWTMGVKNYPVNMDFEDQYAANLEEARGIYDYTKLIIETTENIRRFKPLVVVSHDQNGEYGHGGHMILCSALCEALEKAKLEDFDVGSVEKYGAWDVPKTYLHLYKEHKLTLDLRKESSAFGGKKLLDVVKDAYKKHETQQWCWFYVSDGIDDNGKMKPYSCADFGLYRTIIAVAEDGEMFSGLKTYEEIEAENPEPTETATEEPTEDPDETAEIIEVTPDATTETIVDVVIGDGDASDRIGGIITLIVGIAVFAGIVLIARKKTHE